MNRLASQGFSKQKGFTLIELVVVIVILGILAATAAPKFIDLTSDARESVMKGVQGSINSAVSIVHAKALVEGQTGKIGEILIGTQYYALVYGFPAAIALGTGGTTRAGLGIDSLVVLESGSDIKPAPDATDATIMVFTHSGATDGTECQISYKNAANSETPPTVEATLTAC
tara:strand:- start:1486 stop:2001 length:516 start_codon:yes stop_codon:yes gene_type:complete